MPPRRGRHRSQSVENSIIGQLGLALRVSPTRARELLRIARDLHLGLDGRYALRL